MEIRRIQSKPQRFVRLLMMFLLLVPLVRCGALFPAVVAAVDRSGYADQRGAAAAAAASIVERNL